MSELESTSAVPLTSEWEEESRKTYGWSDFERHEIIRMSGKKGVTIPLIHPDDSAGGLIVRLVPTPVAYYKAFIHFMEVPDKQTGGAGMRRIVCSGDARLYEAGKFVDPKQCLSCHLIAQKAERAGTPITQKTEGVATLNYYFLCFNYTHREDHFKNWLDKEKQTKDTVDESAFVPPLSVLEIRRSLWQAIFDMRREFGDPTSYRIRLYKFKDPKRAKQAESRPNFDIVYRASPIVADIRTPPEWTDAETEAIKWFVEGRVNEETGEIVQIPDLSWDIMPTSEEDQKKALAALLSADERESAYRENAIPPPAERRHAPPPAAGAARIRF